MQSSRVTVGDTTLAVTTAGPEDGPAVVLLHGFPDRAELWSGVVPGLAAAGYRVVAPDLRGFGESDRPPAVEDYRMRALVGDVVGLLDQLGMPTAHVVGHDWGAGLAWSVAMQAADRVDSLTVLSVGHGGTKVDAGFPQCEQSWYMLWFLFPGVAEEVMPRDDWAFLRSWGWRGAPVEAEVQRQVDDLSRPGALTAALNWYRANIDPARFVQVSPVPAGKLPRVSCPTMGVWSTLDPFLGEAQMRESGQFVDGPWRFEVLEGVDHWIPVRAPERVVELLLDFLPAPGSVPSDAEGTSRE